MTPKRRARRLLVTICGFAVLFVGIIAIPYPGPGWLIVFAGLGILRTEFDWAKRLLDYGRARYDAWQEWLKTQSPLIRVGFWLFTAVIVVATIYLLNGYGILNDWLSLGQDWVKSPLVP
jgi:uncharacterized protein (TIGR02611 family)